MDATDEQAERMLRASESQDTPIEEEQRQDELKDMVQDVAEEERARRVRRRRDMLQQELEIVAMEQQLDVLRRQRNAGHTPGGDPGLDEDSRAGSVASFAASTQAPRRGPASRPRLKEPDTFKGKTLKEARDFIRSLELVFALAPDAYSAEQEKILYGVMFLAGEPRETWHQNHSVSDLDEYLWDDFKSFVLDAVEDPVNRSLSTTISYENARQGEQQSAQAFAIELATIEEQMAPYTNEQRTRHLLAKLKPALRTSIISYVVLGSTKRHAGDSHADRVKKRRGSPSRSSSALRAPPSQQQSRGGAGATRSATNPQCYGCKEYGHIRPDCPNKDKWSAEDRAVRKVGASAPKAKGTAKGLDKSEL
jgi:hypothetical protein